MQFYRNSLKLMFLSLEVIFGSKIFNLLIFTTFCNLTCFSFSTKHLFLLKGYCNCLIELVQLQFLVLQNVFSHILFLNFHLFLNLIPNQHLCFQLQSRVFAHYLPLTKQPNLDCRFQVEYLS